MKRLGWLVSLSSLFVIALGTFLSPIPSYAADKKPNILVIWGDDIGYWNVSAYNQGMMGLQDAQH